MKETEKAKIEDEMKIPKPNPADATTEKAIMGKVASELLGAEKSETTGREIIEEFVKKHIIVIEDQKWISEKILENIGKIKGDSGPNVILANTQDQSCSKLSELLATFKGGESIMAVCDMTIPREIPVNEGGIDTEEAGIEAMNDLRTQVDKWNITHADQEPIILQVVANSTKIGNESDREYFIEQHPDFSMERVVGVSMDKENPTDAMLEAIRKELTEK